MVEEVKQRLENKRILINIERFKQPMERNLFENSSVYIYII